MFSRPHLRLLSVLAIIFAIAHANWLDANVLRRQDDGLLGGVVSAITEGLSLTLGANTDSAAATSTTPSSSDSSTSVSSTPTSIPASTTPSTSSTPITSSSLFSSTPQSTSSPSSTQQGTSSTSVSTSKDAAKTTTSPDTSASATVIVKTTVIDGSSKIYSTTSSVSSSSTATNAASLNGSDSSKSTGMSSKTRNTVIGVVVGIGGAIVLAALFAVAWRIWGRQKNEDESDGLMGFRTGSAGQEKNGSTNGLAGPANPFQTTLDQYHNPNGKVNASSNF